MTDVTLCPQCTTRFKVSQTQLEAHDGLVRCGRCQFVFNARECLQVEGPSPQLSLLVDDTQAPASNEPKTDTARLTPIESWHHPSAWPDAIHATQSPEPKETSSTLAQQVQFVDDLEVEDVPATGGSRRYWMSFLTILLFLLFAAQGVYHYRDTLAVKLPGLKPLLTDLCNQLACSIELPRDVEGLAIISSELEADAQLENVITLHVLLHNRAGFSQAWPSLELTLTDSRDNIIVRRSFHPADYLANEKDQPHGIGKNQEQQISLKLDTSDLRPSGYRLLLFYPK
jgi:predicted Zn finger-like uncharacterized protein